jgi:hypothetical protein
VGAVERLSLAAAGSTRLHQLNPPHCGRVRALKIYDTAPHGLLHEPEGAAVRQEVLSFMEARLRASR